MSRKRVFKVAPRSKWRSKFFSKEPTSTQALKLAKKVDKKQKRSLEYILGKTTTSTDPFNVTPVDDHLTEGIAGQGMKTRITSVIIKGTIKRNVTSTIVDDYRIDLVLDRYPTGAKATPALVYGSATPVLGAHKNMNLKTRFKILRSRAGVLDDAGPSGIYINWYVKLNLLCETKVVGNYAIANLVKNSIMLFYWTTAANNQPIPALVSQVIIEDQQ